MTGIYQAPDPPIGPDRASNAYPMTDFERNLRQILRGHGWLESPAYRMKDPAAGSAYGAAYAGPEQFASHEEYVAAAHEIWGDDL